MRGTTIISNTDGSVNVDVASEILKGNEENEIAMPLITPIDTVEADIIVTPIYSMDEVEQAALHSVSMKAVVNPPTDRCKNQQYQRISHLVAAGNARI